jgi:hypothetical protein
MPTPDASAFTRQSKLRAYISQPQTNDVKVMANFYQPIILTSGSTDFLPSFTNKFVLPYSRFTASVNMNKNYSYVRPKRIF